MHSFIRHAVCGITLALTALSAAGSDAFPNRPVRIIVNSAAGGQLDAHSRLVALEMAKALGQPVVVENRTGADGLIGIRYVKTAPADGYTILATGNTFAQNPALKGDTGYDIAKDFQGIGMISLSPLVMVSSTVHAEKTLAEVIAKAKANPDKLAFSSGGVGTSSHMAAALFLAQAGIRMLHVPYKGNAAGQPDVLAGRVNINFDGARYAAMQAREGKLRILGVSTAQRSPAMPDIPTIAEQGVPNYEYVAYIGLVLPAGTPRDVVQRLHQALQAALASDAVRDRFRADGTLVGSMTPEQFTAYVQDDEKRTFRVAKELGLLKQ